MKRLQATVVSLLLACAAVAVLWFSPAAGAASNAACPTAPEGWSAAPPAVDGPVQNPGQQHTMLTCVYSKPPTATVSVIAEYALPANPNPFSDFFFGCDKRRTQPWTPSGRTYFITSSNRWSYVTFADPGRLLPDADVEDFKSVAQSLLENVASSAHDCHLNTTSPTVARQSYLFSFEFLLMRDGFRAFGGVSSQTGDNILVPSGRFSTVLGEDATTTANVVAVKAPELAVRIVEHGKKYTVHLRIARGLDFFQKPPKQRLRFALVVARSDYADCAKGQHGTLVISRNQFLNAPHAPAAVRLHLCGSVFGRGTYRATARIVGAG